jgi:two-component system, LytTR family, sensor kinase
MNTIPQFSKSPTTPVRIFLQLAFWAFFITLPILLRTPDKQKLPPVPDSTIMWLYALNIPIFYINSKILIPKILRNKGVLLYSLSVLSLVLVFLGINYIVRQAMLAPLGYTYRITVFTLFPMIFAYAASTSYRLMSDYIAEAGMRQEIENERLKSELAFLRSQISPHFMFNVLNSIVSLARKKSELVEPVTLKLSELMRYMLYESDDRKVSLEREIEYLKSYIDLQRLRFGDSIQITLITPSEVFGQSIEPMLLIPFVENAFKHGTGLVADPVITIEMATTQNTFSFMVINKIAPFFEKKDNNSGIGLSNVKRRLSLLYPQNHTLKIEEKDGMFKTLLRINFQDLKK